MARQVEHLDAVARAVDDAAQEGLAVPQRPTRLDQRLDEDFASGKPDRAGEQRADRQEQKARAEDGRVDRCQDGAAVEADHEPRPGLGKAQVAEDALNAADPASLVHAGIVGQRFTHGVDLRQIFADDLGKSREARQTPSLVVDEEDGSPVVAAKVGRQLVEPAEVEIDHQHRRRCHSDCCRQRQRRGDRGLLPHQGDVEVAECERSARQRLAVPVAFGDIEPDGPGHSRAGDASGCVDEEEAGRPRAAGQDRVEELAACLRRAIDDRRHTRQEIQCVAGVTDGILVAFGADAR
nr:hypothetical protein [Methylobacterium iners]